MAMLSTRRVAPCKATRSTRASRVAPVVRAAAVSSSEVPDMDKRNVMNLILAGGVALPASAMAVGVAAFFVPPRCEAVPIIQLRPSTWMCNQPALRVLAKGCSAASAVGGWVSGAWGTGGAAWSRVWAAACGRSGGEQQALRCGRRGGVPCCRFLVVPDCVRLAVAASQFRCT
jgi:hypothetical protein